MGWHEVGDGAVFLVGEERCGWQWVIEVEDDRGWNRFWVKDKNFFGGKADEGGSSRKTDRGLRFWEIGFMRRLRQSGRKVARRRLARKPKWRMRTKPSSCFCPPIVKDVVPWYPGSAAES
jgi:hypothetical protein